MGAVNIPHGSVVYADTSVLIYTVEKHPTYLPMLVPLWSAARSESVRVVTSELTLAEVLVLPYRSGNEALAAEYEHFLSLPVISPVPVDESILRLAARYRARTSGLRLPDAIHVATAVREQATLVLTNDAAFRGLPHLPVQLLSELG